MRDFTDQPADTRKRIGDAETYLRIEELRARRPLLETEASRPDLWADAAAATRVTGALSTVIDDTRMYARLAAQLEADETPNAPAPEHPAARHAPQTARPSAS